MNATWLRTLLVVRTQRNFTYAAEELKISQPAVSRQIRQLEADIGVPLVEQVGKYVDLTQAGALLALEAERILGDMERTREHLKAYNTASVGALRIGTSTTTGLYLLPKIIHHFCKDYPDVEINFTVQNSRLIERGVLSNDFDVGFVASPSESPDINAEALLKDHMTCFAAAHHPLAEESRCSPRQLSDATWIVREAGSATRTQCDLFLGKLGVLPARRIELTHPETIKQLVGTGLGVSFMSLLALEDEFEQKRLVPISTAGAKLDRTLYLLLHRRKRLSPVINAFREILDGYLTRHYRQSKGA